MLKSPFLQFGAYALWIATGYEIALRLIYLFHGISLEMADLFPVIFPIIASFFIAHFGREPIDEKSTTSWKTRLAFLVGALTFWALSFLGLRQLWLHFDSFYFIYFTSGFGVFAMLSLGLFYPYSLLKRKKISIILFTILYGLGLFIFLSGQYYWPLFAQLILSVLGFSFDLFGANFVVIPQIGIIGLNSFKVGIGLPCIGLTSLLLFWGFYGGYAITEWERENLNIAHFLILFVVGLISLMLLNVIRIGVLLLIGAYYSPEFAITLFHEFAGFALFLLFTIPYFLLTRRWLSHSL